MVGKARSIYLNVTVPVYAICGSELQIRYRGRLTWVRRTDWELI